jgi:hypothetical protein
LADKDIVDDINSEPVDGVFMVAVNVVLVVVVVDVEICT